MASAVSSTPSTQSVRTLRLLQTIAYFIAFIVLGLSTASIGPTLGPLAAHTGSTLAQVSVLFTARAFGYMVGSLVGGRLYDRFKGNPIIGLAFTVMAVMLALTPVLSQLWLLSLVLVLLSLADGIIDVGCNTLLVWAHGRSVGTSMNALHFFFGVGAFLSPVLVAQVLTVTGDVHWAYWVIAALALIPAVLSLRTPSPAQFSHAESRTDLPQRDVRLLVLIGAFFFAIVGMEATFAGWIASYGVATGFGNEAQMAVLTSVFWGGFTLARLLSIPLATRLSPRTMLWTNLAGCVGFSSLMLVAGNSDVMVWIGAFGLGFGIAPLFPTMISFAETRMSITGKVTSVFLASSSLGGMTLPFLVGQLFVPVGPATVMWAVFLCALGATAVVFVVQRR